MYDAMVVEVCDSREGGTDKVASVRFVVVALSADAVKEFTSKREVGDKID
jgi:hypothetical protein